MNIKIKQQVLNKIYAIYDDFAKTIDVACQPGCAACCTQNVTVTTNEAFRVFYHLNSSENVDWKPKLDSISGNNRFRPAITTNQLAALCMTGKDIPPEDNHTTQKPCPFLENNLCAIYSERPFGCRCFVSKQDCRTSDYADVDPFVLTVNTVFLQFLEHIDTPGAVGNFTDMLIFFAKDENASAYEANKINLSGTCLISNRSIPTLLVPPEHQQRIQPILTALQGIQIPR